MSSDHLVTRFKSWDVLLLFILLMTRVRIDTLADLVLPTRHQDVTSLPWVQRLLSPHSVELLQDWMTDPVGLILISVAFASFFLYLLVDLLDTRLGPVATYRLKVVLVFVIIGLTVLAGSAKLISLRQVSGPASYCHDGGVIQTEEATKLFLAGKNPYVEHYADTPLAEWGVDFRSAIYHYPYLPWTFVFSAPFFALAQAVWGWFDQRLIYLPLFVLTLLLALRLTENRMGRLALVMVLGLNPIMGSDLIFGQNDSFVLFWIVLSLWLLPQRPGEDGQEWRYMLSSLTAGLACATKPTAWFIMPFYLICLLDIRRPWSLAKINWSRLKRLVPLLLVLIVLIVPYILWDAHALYDDVWKWSAGTSEVPYQIRGWGFSIWILALGLVDTRLDYYPFWIPQLLVSLPFLLALAWRQMGSTRPSQPAVSSIALNGAILLFVYSFFSRFSNENYVGFIAALLAIGVLAGWSSQRTRSTTTGEDHSSPVTETTGASADARNITQEIV